MVLVKNPNSNGLLAARNATTEYLFYSQSENAEDGYKRGTALM